MPYGTAPPSPGKLPSGAVQGAGAGTAGYSGASQSQHVAAPIRAAGGSSQVTFTFPAGYVVVDNLGPTPVGVSTVGPPASTGATATFIVPGTSWVARAIPASTRVWLNSATPISAVPWGPVDVYAVDPAAAAASPAYLSGVHPAEHTYTIAGGGTVASGGTVGKIEWTGTPETPFRLGQAIWVRQLMVSASEKCQLYLPVPGPGGVETGTYETWTVPVYIPATTGLVVPMGTLRCGYSSFVIAGAAVQFTAAVTTRLDLAMVYRGFPVVVPGVK